MAPGARGEAHWTPPVIIRGTEAHWIPRDNSWHESGSPGIGWGSNIGSSDRVNAAAVLELCYQLMFSEGNKLEHFVEKNMVDGLGIRLQILKDEELLNDLSKLYVHPEKKWGKKRLYESVTGEEAISNGSVDANDGIVDVINAAQTYTFTLYNDLLFDTFGNKPTDMAIVRLDGVYRQGASGGNDHAQRERRRVEGSAGGTVQGNDF